MRTILALAIGASLMSACGDNAPPEPTPADNLAAENAAMALEERVEALSPGQRNGVFIRAIRDAGLNCQGVTEATKNPPPARATWTATCADGSRHVIAFGADGMAQVTSAIVRR